MNLGKLKIFLLILIIFSTNNLVIFADDTIKSVPLINLEELLPTFEEDVSEIEKIENGTTILNSGEETPAKSDLPIDGKVYVNLRALNKITAKTSSIKLAVGDIKNFGQLEIKALKCELSDEQGISDAVAYLQVKDLFSKDNNQVFLFNGWSFASSPTLKSLDHPVYDIWIVSCDNI